MHASVCRYQGVAKVRSAEITSHAGDGLPRLGRRPLLVVVLGVAALAAAALVDPPRAAGAPTVTLRPASALESSIVAGVGAIRKDAGLRRVRHSGGLTDAAESHAAWLARTGTFGHRSPGQKPFSRRLQSFYSKRGFSYWVTAENVYWRTSPVGASQVVGAWMASPPHRLNILDRRWSEVGVAAVHVPAAPGVYGGRDVTIVAIEFGTRTR
jgi:uncharacterized protein YkwD